MSDHNKRPKGKSESSESSLVGEAIAMLAGGAAHELNNIFAFLLLHAQLLETLATDDDSKESVLAMRQRVERGVRVANTLFNSAQTAQGERFTLSLKYLLTGLQRRADVLLGDDVTINVDYPQEPWLVAVDPVAVLETLLMLCRASVRAVDGATTIRLSLENVPPAEAPTAGAARRRRPYLAVSVPIPANLDLGALLGEAGSDSELAAVRATVEGHGGLVLMAPDSGADVRVKLYFPTGLEEMTPS